MGDREHVDTLFDHDLHERVAEEVLDSRERHRADAFDLASLAWFDLSPSERLGAHVQDDLGPRRAGAGLGCGGAGTRPRAGTRARAGTCVGASSFTGAGSCGTSSPTGARERDERIGHVGLVRLTPPLAPCLFEDAALFGLESVLHDRTLDRHEFAPEADGSLVGHPDAEITPRPQACLSLGCGLFGRLCRDDREALLTQLGK
jgi:hypothetical protein